MAENEPPRLPESIQLEFDQLFEGMQDPIHKTVVDAIFEAPFDLGKEAVRQFIIEKVREKFPDYQPPVTE